MLRTPVTELPSRTTGPSTELPGRSRSSTARARPAGGPGQPRIRFGWWVAIGSVLLVGGLGWWQLGVRRAPTAPSVGYTVINTFPHDPQAFCQGLLFHDGFLYESTGNYGASSLRKVELATGVVQQQHDLASDLFGEGIALWNDQIVQLTWKNRVAIVYDRATFVEVRRHTYQGVGWGLTSDGRQLIMSDGTATLRFLDPETFQVRRQVTVRDGTRRVTQLNELEYIEGEVYANIWYEDRIARIAPATGQVVGWLDLTGLLPAAQRPNRDAVLNGIAYDAQQHRLFVTGKHWPLLFEIRPAR